MNEISVCVPHQGVIETDISIELCWSVPELDNGYFGGGDGNNVVQVFVLLQRPSQLLHDVCAVEALATGGTE